MDEEAKAVQEGAKAIHKAIELAEKAGGFLGRVFGPLLEDGVGLVHDRIRFYRITRFYELRDKTEAILAERGVIHPRPVPPKVALPLLEAATREDSDYLHDLWARLLANAMDAGVKPVTRSFIGILEQFEPNDARLLDFLYRSKQGEGPTIDPHRLGDGSLAYELAELADAIGMPKEECELSLFNLDRLGCLSVKVTRYERLANNPYWPITQAVIHLTIIGKAIVEACMR